MQVITSNNLQMNLRNWIGEIKLHHVYPGNRDEIMLTVDINIQKDLLCHYSIIMWIVARFPPKNLSY